MEDVLQDDIM